MTEKLSVKNLCKIFGDDPDAALAQLRAGRSKDEILKQTGMTVGVQDANFSVGQGEIFVVMGLSGSGKSTLVRMLNRLIEPTAGEVRIDGEDIVSADPEQLRQIRLKKIAMVFQHFALFPHKTVAENVEYGLKVQGVPAAERRRRAIAALEQVGLEPWADHRPQALSGGMQQRVGLARGLAVDPEVLLMDEPFSALDPLIRRDMQQELIELQRKLKMTIVFITHDLHEALILGDHIAIMKEGRFVQIGTAEEIVGEPADDYVSAFTQDIDRAKVFAADSVMAEPQALELSKDTPRSALERMTELKRNALYVLDGDRIAGVVTYRGLAGATSGHGGDLGAALIREYPAIESAAKLYRLYDLARGELPVAVLDDGRLVGVARQGDIFKQLAAGAGEAEGAARQPAPAGA
ncbi:glycine betaine/proline transport system ATP-binding protein [Tistlia consotensis]|uniref:Quaternary amine transport ATP-binding protein n=1 Tax=Tistlia consotensis USBA 355 TaxID=560819 RepID=A0A1Y6BU83_9PROT|nr:glycine betaine/L-proline ABC transporter ATP-binding protein [Tistlia consotensis]SMF18665.1 glycine betaine/proline transport system ATP-binding protein [Tistlia consotensis USBA 355]SNR39529.1 glycine betaine/proline transport system ATP-binding protein [Tistlia consotensis]